MRLPYNGLVAPLPSAITSNKMYSSYGNQRRNANVLRFTPPGFKHSIDVQFPPRCLPVCERCKKNFKTREHCRGRDCHTDLAWCETYVCVSLDNSCTGDDNKLLDGPFVAKVVPPIAFNLKGDLNPLTPICAPCKDKNYTRTYCRQNKNHRQLPWSTVYVIVSLKPGVAPERSASGSNKRRKSSNENREDLREDATDDLKRKVSGGNKNQGDDTKKSPEKESRADGREPKKGSDSKDSSDDEDETGDKVSEKKCNEKKKDDPDPDLSAEELHEIECRKLDDIPRSRTFLSTVSCKTLRIEWVDVDPMLETQLPMLNENNDSSAQDAYEMRNSNPMMHHSMHRSMGSSDGITGVNPGMADRMAMAQRMRSMNGNNGMNMNSMGGFGSNMSAMNVPSAVFNDDPRSSMDSQMMSNSMGRYSAQDMMGHHMDQMRHMDNMRQMRQMSQMQQMQQQMGGPFPVETPSMPSRMGYGGNFTQEMMQFEAIRNRDGFDRQQMMNSMPSYSVSGNFAGDMSLDRMPPSGMGGASDIIGGMPRGRLSGSSGSDMMMMMNNGNMDMMSGMNRSGTGQDMLRASTFDRMSRGDMMLNRTSLGMGLPGERSQNWRNELGDQGGGAQVSNISGYDNIGHGSDDMKKQGPPDNGDNGF